MKDGEGAWGEEGKEREQGGRGNATVRCSGVEDALYTV